MRRVRERLFHTIGATLVASAGVLASTVLVFDSLAAAGQDTPVVDATASQVTAELAARAASDLPPGFSLQVDQAVAGVVGANRLYRFPVAYDGVPLSDSSSVTLIVGPAGQIVGRRVTRLPQAVDSTSPSIRSDEAGRVALAAAVQVLGESAVAGSAAPTLEIIERDGLGRLSWHVAVRAVEESGRGSIGYWIAAIGTPVVLATSDLRHYQNSVHAQGTVWQNSPLATETAALSDLTLMPGVVTDANGDAALPAGQQLIVFLRGPYADVTPPIANQRLVSMLSTTGGNDLIDFASAVPTEISQITAFHWTSRTNRWARTIVPSLNGSGTLLDALRVRVNVTGLPCNAFFDEAGVSVSFGAATASCRNAATPTVIAHEVGHAVHAAVNPGMATTDGGYREGLADAVSALVTGDSCFGRDEQIGGAVCSRDSSAFTPYPDPSADAHAQGRPYAQFAWILREQLGAARAGELVLGAALAGATTIPEAVHLAFVLDDDDGRLDTCSANQQVLEEAADSRSIPRPPDCGEGSAPPAAPMLTSTSPASPGSSRMPTVMGLAPGAVSVRLYFTSCAGTPVATGAVTASAFAVPVTVPAASTSLIVAEAVDAADQVSPCSTPVRYTHAPPTVSIADASVFEGAVGQGNTLEFAVSLGTPATAPVVVNFSTVDGSAAGSSDYKSRSGTVSFAVGESAKRISILVVGDGLVERDETVTVRVSAQGAPVSRNTATGTIRNDDNVGTATLTPTATLVRPQDVVPFEFGWVVPAQKPDGTPTNNHWRDLKTMTLRLVGLDGSVAFEVVWVQDTNTFQVRRPSGKFGPSFLPGSNTEVQKTALMSLNPADVVVRTAPGPAMSILLPIKLLPQAALQLFVVQGAATDDFGSDQSFETLGFVLVGRR